ncbi:MAG: hydantoinase B/oxoprolinase family protein [Frankia sp.]|nr:hydantoinase B/oxoprolinase family protein [Frankia sp.]
MVDAGDAVTAEVIRNGLLVAVEEASIVVVRSAHSTFIQEGADACAALLDADARLLAQSTATTLMHSSSLRCSLPSVVETFPLAGMAPGDVFAVNDPYRGGIHANDILVFRPIFVDGVPRYFAGTLVHIADLGGAVPGGLSTLAGDTFAEGLMLPPVRLYRAGEPVDDVWRVIAANSRTPAKAVGDVQALVSGTHVLAASVERLLARYGGAELARFLDAYLAATERQMRAELAALPAGRYQGSFTIDTDGVSPGHHLVSVTVTLDGAGGIVLDFAGTGAQSPGAINASVSQTLSGVLYAVRCLLDPAIPMNEGCFRPLDVRLPAGSLVNPNPPAACGGRLVTVTAAIEAILDALAAARPDRAVAGSGLVHVYTLAGRGVGDVPWVTLLYEFGGIGARAGSDGPDANGAYFTGGRSVIPQIEPLETAHPLLVRAARVRQDSGGAGRFRGGLGAELDIELLDDAVLTVRGDRMELPPPGRDGGHDGAPGYHRVLRRDGRLEELKSKQVNIPLRAGDRFLLATSGGGGLGPPRLRAPELVAADVSAGRVSERAARETYGWTPPAGVAGPDGKESR